MKLAIRLLHSEHAPRRFSLIGVHRDQDGDVWDLEIVGWGLQWRDEALAYLPPTPHSKTVYCQGSTAETIVARYGHENDLLLAWIDPETPGQRS
ncbi:hypothetical protein [Amycolatopsis nigrescens]|uniref:hypothetical protein n=1 Tax=Amycolatopsis nigrescens TaxID=381445 RepID=UPI0003665392|nr:hypothetical protein [Amycolatopsis nigrescens]